MIRRMLAALVSLLLCIGAAAAQCGAYPNTLANGQPADANQVMANFNFILNCLNSMAAPRGHLGGLTMSNDGVSPNTVIDTAAGVAASDDATTLMTLPAFTKNANAAWAVGNGSGCLDSGSSLSANTWYHLFVIERTDTSVVDELCSQSAASPVLPASYTKKRRIGSFRTDSSVHILAFKQLGDEFLWSTPVGDVSVSNLGTTATSYMLSVPTNIQVWARVRGWLSNAVYTYMLVYSTDENTVSANSPVGNINATVINNTSAGAFEVLIRTNTSAQIKAVASQPSTVLAISTFGWIDRRGRDQ